MQVLKARGFMYRHHLQFGYRGRKKKVVLVMGAGSAQTHHGQYLHSQFPEEYVGNTEPSAMLLQGVD